jgi:hypothetical protein
LAGLLFYDACHRSVPAIPESHCPLRRLGQPNLGPDFRERLHEMFDIGVGVMRGRRDTQASKIAVASFQAAPVLDRYSKLGQARHRRPIVSIGPFMQRWPP